MRVGSVGMPALQAETVEFINADSPAIIGSGSSEITIITAPLGYIYEIVGITLHAFNPSGSTTGTHSFSVYSQTGSISILGGSSNFGSNLQYFCGEWVIASATQNPADPAAQALHPIGKRMDANNGLTIKYTNSTDVNSTGTRTMRLWVRKVKVAN